MKKVSVIIVTYNSERHIYECLESLFRFNDIGDDLEVIVVDNCSKDYEGMAKMIISRYGDKVKLVQNTKNGGYGQGNNVGIRKAESPIVMIMNPDVRLCEPLFAKISSEFDQKKNLAMYGFTQRHEDGSLGRSTAWTSRLYPYIAEPLRYVFGALNIYWQKYMYVSGACFFIRKSAFEDIGLFDEGIFMYNEEDDIHSRLIARKKWKIKYDRQLSYLHLHPVVKNYGEESYGWLEKNLQSLIYMNERDGISRKKTIVWSIKRTNISIWSEKIKKCVGQGDDKRIDYYKGWKERQLQWLEAEV